MDAQDLEAAFWGRVRAVDAAETRYQATLTALTEAGCSVDVFDALLASLPPNVIEERDIIICSFPGYDDAAGYLEVLAEHYGVQDTMHKLHLIEIAMGAGIDLEDASRSLDTLLQRIPAKLRQHLEEQRMGQLEMQLCLVTQLRLRSGSQEAWERYRRILSLRKQGYTLAETAMGVELSPGMVAYILRHPPIRPLAVILAEQEKDRQVFEKAQAALTSAYKRLRDVIAEERRAREALYNASKVWENDGV